MVKLYTSTINYAGDKEKLDITVKSGFGLGKKFAPTWDMVSNFKQKIITEEEFTEQYLDLLRNLYENDFEAFEMLCDKDEIVLCCYCKPHTFCHRYILVDTLIKLGAKYYGEFQKGSNNKWINL